jgi:hypothetical protein
MSTLKVGYDVFAGASQAGTDSGVPGLLTAETAKKGKHKVRIQRLSDNWYWNNTSGAFQAGATAEADELDFEGSYSASGRGIHPAIRRLKMRIPKEVVTGATAAGLKMYVYATGDSPTTYVEFNYLP